MATESVYLPSKTCKDCEQVLPLTAFHRHNNTKDKHGIYCRACSSVRHKKWRAANHVDQDKANANFRRAWTKVRGLVNEVKRQSSCFYCGEYEIVCLDFHHIDPTRKDIDISKCRGVEAAVAEMEKCVLVCKNCHAKVHAKMLPTDGLVPLSSTEIEAAITAYSRDYLFSTE